MMNELMIKEYCEKAFTRAGYDFNNYDIAIVINGRITKTLGRCFYKRERNKVVPTKIEISRQLIETSSTQTIVDVIYHECAHALASIETGEQQGHNKIFKEMCARIGTTNDGVSTHVERTVTQEEVYKYTIYCPNCGFRGGYNRMCKTLQNLAYCSCKDCGSHELFYKQNR